MVQVRKVIDAAMAAGRLTMSLNVWCFTGRLGRDAETRYLPAGTQVLDSRSPWNVGTATRKHDLDEVHAVRRTWWKARAVSDQRDASRSIRRSQSARKWQDRDGGKRSTLEVRVDKVEMIGKRDDAGLRQEPQKRIQQAASPKF